MDIMEIIKNRKWTWLGQVTLATEWIRDGVQHRQFGHPWVAKEIVGGNEKGGKMNYNSTEEM